MSVACPCPPPQAVFLSLSDGGESPQLHLLAFSPGGIQGHLPASSLKWHHLSTPVSAPISDSSFAFISVLPLSKPTTLSGFS